MEEIKQETQQQQNKEEFDSQQKVETDQNQDQIQESGQKQVLIFDILSFEFYFFTPEFQRSFNIRPVQDKVRDLKEVLEGKNFRIIAFISGQTPVKYPINESHQQQYDKEKIARQIEKRNTSVIYDIKYILADIFREQGIEVQQSIQELDHTIANWATFYNGSLMTSDVTSYRFFSKEKQFFEAFTNTYISPFQLINSFNIQVKKDGEKVIQLPERFKLPPGHSNKIHILKDRNSKIIIRVGPRGKKSHVTRQEVPDDQLFPTVLNCNCNSLIEYNFSSNNEGKLGMVSEFDRTFGKNTPQNKFLPLRQALFSHLQPEGGTFKEETAYWDEEKKEVIWDSQEHKGIDKSLLDDHEKIIAMMKEVMIIPTKEQQENEQFNLKIRKHNANIWLLVLGYLKVYQNIPLTSYYFLQNLDLTKGTYEDEFNFEQNFKIIQ